MTVRIANATGFLGDNLDAPRLLVEAATVEYLTLEYLAELTLSILARQKEQDPSTGFAGDLLEVLTSLGGALRQQSQLRIVTNGGGMNPTGCAEAVARLLSEAQLSETLVGVVTGDDILPQVSQWMQEGCEFTNLDTGQPLADLKQPMVSANAYLGARPIADALGGGARLVITGRVADVSLTVGPAMHEFGWSWDDWDRLAAASVAGHLIECGAQVTGGYSTDWEAARLSDVGYPIAELTASAATTITKPVGSGGVVNARTVTEQLVYEIGDPAAYITPDVVADFTSVWLEDCGEDRVAVRGSRGLPAPEHYKVSLAYRHGYMASAQLLVFGRGCVRKARASAEMVLDRVRLSGFHLAHVGVECLGTGAGVPQRPTEAEASNEPPEVVLRICVHDPRREAVERFTKEIAPLITSGPAGLAGYASGRSPVRPVYAYWPTLVPKSWLTPRVEVRRASEWLPAKR